MLTKLILIFYLIQNCVSMELHLSNLNLSTADINALLGQYSLPFVVLPLGFIQGNIGVTNRLVVYNKFEGIPYAAPPVGNRRFMKPIPVKSWHGVWIARSMHKCIQHQEGAEENIVVGSEDCLYINIYAPQAGPGQQFDVLVNIHGGSFMHGYGGQYKPDNFINNNIIYITFNYRLGPLGFLSTEDTIVPGNNGIKDQLLALKFIQEHVAAFGGNPKSITLLGTQAGGASVNLHYFLEKSGLLFQRGVSQSGTLLNPWVLTEQPLNRAKQLAKNVGCFSNITSVMVRCLKQRPARQIIEQVRGLQPFLGSPLSPFALVIDKWAPNPVLPVHPYKMLQKRLLVERPWIVSFTPSDGWYSGGLFYNNSNLDILNTHWNRLLPHILDYNFTASPENHDLISEAIRQKYFNNANITKKNFKKFVALLTHRLYETGIRKTAQMQANRMWSPVYMYQYAYNANLTKQFGAVLGDDTDIIFNSSINAKSPWDDLEMHRIMLEMVVSFVKTGKPLVPVYWSPVEKKALSLNYLVMAGPKNLAMVSSKFSLRRFWKSLPIIENKQLFINATQESSTVSSATYSSKFFTTLSSSKLPGKYSTAFSAEFSTRSSYSKNFSTS